MSMITAISSPCRVTTCGPSACAVRMSSLKRCLASCTGHSIGAPPFCLDCLDRLPHLERGRPARGAAPGPPRQNVAHDPARMSAMSTAQQIPSVILPGGGRMPLVGFGTWQIRGRRAYEATAAALDAGYRHIDTATMYGNEAEVGRAL